jgi:isopentenyl-diphosphate delta-isomerase type 1
MSEEIFDVVDENDKIIGKTTRKEVHDKKLTHRSVMFFIFDKDRKILVTQRTKTKDMFPEYWSITLGGHVNSGETYEKAVVREAWEEAKIKEKPFFITSFKKRIPEEKENSRIYGFITNQKPKLEKKELKQGKFMTIKEIEEKIKEEKFLPETEFLLKTIKNLF